MKYIEIFSKKRVFNFSFVETITQSKNLARETLRNYLKNGYIKRVKKNLYVTMSFETGGVIPSKFEIASNITQSSFVSHHSAFEFYGFTQQVYNEVVTSSTERFYDFTFENNVYVYKHVLNDTFVETINGVRVSTLPKTIVDCIADVKSYDDMEELIQQLSTLPVIDGSKVMEVLMSVNKKILFNKVGLVLSHFKDGHWVNDTLLNQMKEFGIKGVKYFTNEKHRLNTYDKEWHLYGYDMKQLIGGSEDESI